MADRFPLILNTSTNQIQEIPSGDNLDLTGVGINNVGVITSGNVQIGAATTDLIVTGDARITGILTVGTDSITLNETANTINVGTALTLGHTQGLQFHTQNLHSEGFEINQINLSGIATFNEARFANSKRLKFGDDIDLQIYHFPAGSGNNYISAANNTGIVVSAQNVSLMNQNHSAYFFKGEAAGSIVYHNNTARVTTTSTGINVTGNNVVSGNVTAVDGTFSGNVSIGGTLTYEDVTNIDSIGIITARNGITVSSGTATFQGAIDANGDLDVDGHTNLDNVSISGLTTASQGLRVPNGSATSNYISVGNNGALRIWGTTHQFADIRSGNLHFRNNSLDNILEIQQDKDIFLYGPSYFADTARFDSTVTIADTITHHGDTDTKIRFPTADTITFETAGSERLRVTSGGHIFPGADSTNDLGTTGTRFRNAYVDTYYGDGSNLTGIDTDLVNDTSPQLGGDLDCNNKLVTLNDSTGASNNRLKIGNAGDLQLFHQSNANYVSGEVDGKDLYVRSRRDLHLVCGDNSGGYRNVIYADNNGSARLYHPASAAVRLQTTTYGVSIGGSAGSISATTGIEISNAATTEIRLKNTSGGSGATDGFAIQKWNNGHTYLYEYDNQDILIGTNNATRWRFTGGGGHFEPWSNNTYDIGSSSKRVRNLYTNDLNLSNEGSSNDVDNTWGDYTIQEGESDLFLINNRSGKKYKFNLTEVS